MSCEIRSEIELIRAGTRDSVARDGSFKGGRIGRRYLTEDAPLRDSREAQVVRRGGVGWRSIAPFLHFTRLPRRAAQAGQRGATSPFDLAPQTPSWLLVLPDEMKTIPERGTRWWEACVGKDSTHELTRAPFHHALPNPPPRVTVKASSPPNDRRGRGSRRIVGEGDGYERGGMKFKGSRTKESHPTRPVERVDRS